MSRAPVPEPPEKQPGVTSPIGFLPRPSHSSPAAHRLSDRPHGHAFPGARGEGAHWDGGELKGRLPPGPLGDG